MFASSTTTLKVVSSLGAIFPVSSNMSGLKVTAANGTIIPVSTSGNSSVSITGSSGCLTPVAVSTTTLAVLGSNQGLPGEKGEKGDKGDPGLPGAGALVYGGLSSGIANHYTVTIPGLNDYVAGLLLSFLAHQTNTGPSFFQLNNLGYIPFKKNGNIDLSPADIAINEAIITVYDGTRVQGFGGLAQPNIDGGLF